MKEKLFLQSVVMQHFYVSSNENISIKDTEIIKFEKTYYIEWVYAMEPHRMYLTINEIKWIADAMKTYLGTRDKSTIAWMTLYTKCRKEEKEEITKVEF